MRLRTPDGCQPAMELTLSHECFVYRHFEYTRRNLQQGLKAKLEKESYAEYLDMVQIFFGSWIQS